MPVEKDGYRYNACGRYDGNQTGTFPVDYKGPTWQD